MVDDPLNRLAVKRGSELPHAKLTEDDVRLILALVAERDELRRRAKQLTNREIAKKFGVHRRTVDKISAGETWIHVA